MEEVTFRFEPNIIVKNPPLIEAWLEIRWMLLPDGETKTNTDPYFKFAVGNFYREIKDRFSLLDNLPSANIPESVTPHIVRYRFRQTKDSWPVFQIGPGIASVNFTQPYNWEMFREAANFLKKALTSAYSDFTFKPQDLILRFRNGFLFEYSISDLQEFFDKKLNVVISLPEGFPGHAASKESLTGISQVFSVDLRQPKGTGKVVIATGKGKPPAAYGASNQYNDAEQIVLELEVASGGADVPSFVGDKDFLSWLDSAHALIHEWFFSFIDGPLRDQLS